MLDGYLGVERLSTPELVAGAREDAIEGLCALSGAAQGELARATGAKATEVEASSEAIQRLIEMDGYAPRRAPPTPRRRRLRATRRGGRGRR